MTQQREIAIVLRDLASATHELLDWAIGDHYDPALDGLYDALDRADTLLPLAPRRRNK